MVCLLHLWLAERASVNVNACVAICVRFQELVQSTVVEELLPEAELARLRTELGQEGEPPIANATEQVCFISGRVWSTYIHT